MIMEGNTQINRMEVFLLLILRFWAVRISFQYAIVYASAMAFVRRVDHSVSFYHVIWLAKEKTKAATSRKSFCRSGTQTLFFGGENLDSRKYVCVRRLCKPRPDANSVRGLPCKTKLFIKAFYTVDKRHQFNGVPYATSQCNDGARVTTQLIY